MSWNPITGCTPVSTGCQNCYARVMAKRLNAMGVQGYEKGFEVTLHFERLSEPVKWKKPRTVFVCSMGDLFHEDVSFQFIELVWDTMFRCSFETEPGGIKFPTRHEFMILTKRPERMAEFYKWMNISRNRHADYPNIWLGVTGENQRELDRRMNILATIPAAKLYVSIEPQLERVNINPWLPALSLVICGCESGPKRRPFDEQWARDLKDQCVAAGVPFMYKQCIQDGKLVKLPFLDGKQWTGRKVNET